MTSVRLSERKNAYLTAIKRLEEACDQPTNSFIMDSVIQRFEFCWELAWKLLKLKLEVLGVSALNPRDVIKEALASGLIHNGNAWTEAQRNRNLTTYTYDEKLADTVYQYIKQEGLAVFQQLRDEIESW